jgi:hypothetical protein
MLSAGAEQRATRVTDWKPRRRSFWQGRGGIVVDVVLVAAVLMVGVALLVPKLRHSPADPTDTGTDTAVSTAAPSVGPDGMRVYLDNTSYTPGHCYTWEQTDTIDTGAQDVPCAGPHLFEAVSTTQIRSDQYPDGSDYPSSDAWGTITTMYCSAAVTTFLGHPLDPHGLFAIAHPSPRWTTGTRAIGGSSAA